ncbi:MAG: DHH family phosphoesterase, partial [Verrucomicrobia bacterium]|nr:DHH family phosphoesterase [Verrucomicrobiota bacterium]
MADGFPRRRWFTPPVDEALAARLARDLDLPLPIATVLAARGYAVAEETEQFLNPRLGALGDPFTMPNMQAAVDRIWRAIAGGEAVLVFGDYDVDGVCSTALVTAVLRDLGAKVTPFLPNRLAHGYGFSAGALTDALATVTPTLIITVDCGTGSTEAVRAAAAAGIAVIVTDHHEPDGAPAPALAVVNPKLVDGHPASMLAGVGVAFKLCHALIKAGMQAGRAAASSVDLREYLDLVAVATIADVVPLVGENRILASHGLKRLNATPRLGFRAILDAAGVRNRVVDTYHVGFVIGPRLNAAGRLGDASVALDLLLTDDPALAARRAQALEAANRERKSIEDEIRV